MIWMHATTCNQRDQFGIEEGQRAGQAAFLDSRSDLVRNLSVLSGMERVWE